MTRSTSIPARALYLARVDERRRRDSCADTRTRVHPDDQTSNSSSHHEAKKLKVAAAPVEEAAAPPAEPSPESLWASKQDRSKGYNKAYDGTGPVATIHVSPHTAHMWAVARADDKDMRSIARTNRRAARKFGGPEHIEGATSVLPRAWPESGYPEAIEPSAWSGQWPLPHPSDEDRAAAKAAKAAREGAKVGTKAKGSIRTCLKAYEERVGRAAARRRPASERLAEISP